MSTHPIPASDYIAVWRRVLSDWLQWPTSRVDGFIARWQDDLTTSPSSGEAFWFYRELPFHYLTTVLLSPDLRSRYKGPDRIEVTRQIERALYDGDTHAHRRPDYDWDTARQRIEAVLARYGASLPTPTEWTFYEEELRHDAS